MQSSADILKKIADKQPTSKPDVAAATTNLEPFETLENGGCHDDAHPLHRAAARGDLNEVRRLIEDERARFKYTYVDRSNYAGYTALWLAARYGHIDIARFLLENGADVNYRLRPFLRKLHDDDNRGHMGTAPLWVAATLGHTKMVRFLLEQGADVNQRCISVGSAPLHQAIYKCHEDVVQILLEYRADVNLVQTSDGTTPLMVAARWSGGKILTSLVKSGADVDSVNSSGETALYIAAEQGQPNIVSYLLDNKAKVNLARNDGNTPFFIALINSHTTVMSLLFDANADINLPNKYTPLHYAAEMGYERLVKCLLRMGANDSLVTKQGLTAAQIAEIMGHTDIVQIFSTENVFRAGIRR